MKYFLQIFETYLMVLVHPFRIHHQFRFQIPISNHGGYLYQPLTLAEAIGISWIFAIFRGIFRIILLNLFLESFLSISDDFLMLKDLIYQSGISSYYFLLFSLALDVIFFPIGTIILTELWAWVIRHYSNWLDSNLPKEQIADQITTHALSSNLFTIIPFIGDLFQGILYYFLIYAGLRANLGASKSLSWIILLTPTVFVLMLISLLSLLVFYLVI